MILAANVNLLNLCNLLTRTKNARRANTAGNQISQKNP